MKKRFLSCFMALALCLSLMPTAAWAEEADPPDGQVVEASGSDDTEKQDAAAEADEPEDTAPAMQKSPAPTAAQSAENVARPRRMPTSPPPWQPPRTAIPSSCWRMPPLAMCSSKARPSRWI